MNIIIYYDSKKGKTKKAAEEICRILKEHNHPCEAISVENADKQTLDAVQLIFFGAWTKGLFLMGQRPTKQYRDFVDNLAGLEGKKAVVFCTYNIYTGPMLKNMKKQLEERKLFVIGKFKCRRPVLNDSVRTFINEILLQYSQEEQRKH